MYFEGVHAACDARRRCSKAQMGRGSYIEGTRKHQHCGYHAHG
jgi:hypothetical protein